MLKSKLSNEERRIIRRVGEEPIYLVRKLLPEMKIWEDEFFDLTDSIKRVWTESRKDRVNLAFTLKWEITEAEAGKLSIRDFSILQQKQSKAKSTLLFEIDLMGNLLDEIDFEDEIDPLALTTLSKLRECVIFWLGPDLEIFCKGIHWNPKHKHEILKDIKSKRRNQLLSIENHKEVLQLHFDNFIRDEATESYWFVKNKLLQPTPEKIFQKSLWRFLRDEVDCIADREPMFKDGSRCDVRVFVDDYDMYFIEIKWIGFSAVRRENTVTSNSPTEFKVDRAIDGAFQTKRYIEKNNQQYFDHKIRLGIYLLYDAYPKPVIPISYGEEISGCSLLDVCEFSLASQPPSKETKGIAKRKGLA